ncbi:glycine reductase [Clostridium sp. 'deep sea']|uniref:glycine/sarcosine/betaine reductase complex component C subunit alpha n=1 Tax=Clostridium sp. 'deep sea' TaxID=2779445 RepID=UPI0018967A9C|nr:glycine/sarcosine/betaine reductase complex component C subunit alpha [Clostridium sp. 'deep sea']QOR34322.1 glycine reductase [Clostridium sp. 'deep sea']
MSKNVQQLLQNVLYEVADAIETGKFGNKVRVAITLLGSEHGPAELLRGAELAQKQNPDIEVVCIGPEMDTELKIYPAADEKQQYKVMEELLDSKEISSCVTMHYSFPIGVSTVGKVIAPANGKELIIATTTGTSATERIEAMVRNAIYGIATAKATGIKEPTVGILNVEGARAVERALNKMKDNGFEFTWAESLRADGGAVMRGNDLLAASPDVIVMDSLTGNVMMKVFSSFSTGGSYEASGFGYGPGVGEDYDRIILILSRASGAPVAANAIKYAAEVARGNLPSLARELFVSANKAGLKEVTATKKVAVAQEEEVVVPPKKIVDEEIPGIEILDLDDAAKAVWKAGIYAETGMGCTGPVILVAAEDAHKTEEILKKAGYIG